jgi:hypothetical protein
MKARNHRPVSPDSQEFKKFKEKIRRKINEVLKKNPHLDFSEELALFS